MPLSVLAVASSPIARPHPKFPLTIPKSSISSLRATILAQPTFSRAIQTAVAGLKALKPTYDWVGVYLLDGDMLTLRDDHYLGPDTRASR